MDGLIYKSTLLLYKWWDESLKGLQRKTPWQRRKKVWKILIQGGKICPRWQCNALGYSVVMEERCVNFELFGRVITSWDIRGKKIRICGRCISKPPNMFLINVTACYFNKNVLTNPQKQCYKMRYDIYQTATLWNHSSSAWKETDVDQIPGKKHEPRVPCSKARE